MEGMKGMADRGSNPFHLLNPRPKTTKAALAGGLSGDSGDLNGRGGEIRTHDLYVPNVALYQAKLRPDCSGKGVTLVGAPR